MKVRRTPRSRITFPALALSLVAACHAASPATEVAGAPAPRRPQPEAERIQEDVAWLADDAREGRRAGTPSELAAARWIGQRLGKLGLEPAGTERWLQPFEVDLPARDGGTSTVAFGVPKEGGTVYAVVQDPNQVVPLFCSAAGEAQGRVVFGGYGIHAPELGWDDYGERSVEGAIVVLVRGTPPDELAKMPAETGGAAANPHGAPGSGSGWGSLGSVFHKVMEAKRRGAAGVLIAMHPDHEGEELLAFDAGSSAQANIPAMMIKGSLAEKLVPDYAALVARIDGGEDLSHSGTAPRSARLKADVVRERATAHNVLGRIPGRRSDRTVVIGAHFDHLGHGGPGSLAPNANGEIHNGADDNASGTAAVLEIARCLVQGPRPEGDVIIALWSGEEEGLLGSKFWAKNPTVPLDDVRANINLDMVGRAGDGKLQVLGAGTAAPLATWLEEAGPRADLDLTISLSGQGTGGSDHQTFLEHEIPAIHFFSGIHTDYHKPTDDVERFEADGARRVVLLTLDVLRRIQTAPALAYVEPKSEGRPAQGGFATRFGSIPEYGYDGEGLLLAGTSAGGPAERAGLLKGDLIVAVDDVRIEGLGDFMYVLNTHKPGDVVLVRFLRDGQEETCKVTLESSQVE